MQRKDGKILSSEGIALESVDFFQREWNCLEKHKQSDSMSRVVEILLPTDEYKVVAGIMRVKLE